MDRATIAVGQWRRELPELDLLPMEVVGRLVEAGQMINRTRLEPLFAQYGLRPGEFDVLATLRRSGDPYALTPTQLYEAAMISSGGMTNRIDRLESASLIERKPNPQDRRGTLVFLTPAGRELVERIVPAHLENERSLLAGLTRDQQMTLSALLGKLIAGLNE